MPLFRHVKNGFRRLRSHPRLVVGLVVVLCALVGAGAGLALGTWNHVCRDCPSLAQLYVWQPKQATKILDRNGKLITELFQERRTPVSIAELPKYVPQAFVAIEDKRFYRHHGFDIIGTTGALVRNIIHGHITGGGSTITQQLARNMFKEKIGFRQRYTRKLKELKVALELEKVYTKDQILEAYINQVNYGRGHWGIESASQWFFGKSAAKVNPAEAALLAAVINLPEYYSPFEHPDRALHRRNLVLRLMNEQGYLSDADYARWKKAPLPQKPHGGEQGDLAPYFVEWVRSMLDERFGADLYRRGFRVYTSLDVDMQQAARVAMDSGWARAERLPGFDHPTYADVMAKGGSKKGETPYLQGMLVAIDPATGGVRALIGGRDFQDSKFDRATQAMRQPGSTFKPILYTAAISSGIPASHIIYDSPLMLEMPDGSIYSPSNDDGEFHGPMTLRQALVHSVNVVAVKLGQQVGMETVVQYARKMGLTTPIPPYPSTAIGAAAVIPIQLADAYTALATPGILSKPQPILKIEDADGRTIWQSHPDRKPVLDSLPVFIARDMMRDVIDSGTGYSARDPSRGNLPYSVPAAGKTGTTDKFQNAWFVGFTPNLVAAVWFGFDDPQPIAPGAYASVVAAPTWGHFMHSVYIGDAPLLPTPPQWPVPAGLVTRQVDRLTGKLASGLCPPDRVYTEYYIPGTEPTQVCDATAGGGLFGGAGLGTPFSSFDTLADTTSAAAPKDTTRAAKPKVNTHFRF